MRLTRTFTLNIGVRLESSGEFLRSTIFFPISTWIVRSLWAAAERVRWARWTWGVLLTSETTIGLLASAPHGIREAESWWCARGYGWVYDFLFLNPIIDMQLSPPFAYGLTFAGGAMTGNNSYANFAANTAAAQLSTQAAIGTFPSTSVNFGSISPVQQNLRIRAASNGMSASSTRLQKTSL